MKKGAVAGAIVWSAPVLMSTPAFASTGCGGSKPCVNFYYAKFENGGCSGGSGDSENTGCRRPGVVGTPLANELCGKSPAIGDGCAFLSTTTSFFTGSSLQLTYPDNLAPLLVQIKAANGCATYRVGVSSLEFVEITESQNAPGGGKVIVPSGDTCRVGTSSVVKTGSTTVVTATWPCGNISHVGTYFCA